MSLYQRYTSKEETQILSDMAAEDQRVFSYRAQATPALAQITGDLYRQYPAANIGVLEAAARGAAAGAFSVEQAQQLANDSIRYDIGAIDYSRNRGPQAEKYGKTQGPPGPGEPGFVETYAPKTYKGWFEYIYPAVKGASRWVNAGLQTTADLTQNVIAQGGGLPGINAIGNVENQAAFNDGWFISTSVGSMIANYEDTGSGWFMGGKAYEMQAERARRYRGTIDGHAFTIGRYLTQNIFQPQADDLAVEVGLKQMAENILSGTIDAYVAMKVPAVPGLKLVTKGITALEELGGLKVFRGLTDFESAAIIPAKIGKWLDTNTGQKVVRVLAEDVTTVTQAMHMFPNANARFWENIVNIDDVTDMRKFLAEAIGEGNPTLGKAPRSMNDFNMTSWSDTKYRFTQGNNWLSKVYSSLGAKNFGNEVVVSLYSDRDAANSMFAIDSYMRRARVSATDRDDLLKEFLNAYNNSPGDLRVASEKLDKILRTSLRASGADKKLVDVMLEGLTKIKNSPLYATVNDFNQPNNFGVKMFQPDGTIVDLPLATAAVRSEIMRNSLILPDARRVRRITSEIGWITGQTGKFDVMDKGEMRLPLVAVEYLQNQVWRPFTLLTGGYVLRNLTDSTLRHVLSADLNRGVFHPLEFMQIAMYKKMGGDIEGISFDDAQDVILRTQKEYAQAVNAQMRENFDPLLRAKQETQTGAWRAVNRTYGEDFVQGVADETHLLANDEIARMIAAGDETDDILIWLETTDEGKQHMRDLQGMWRDVWQKDLNGQEAKVTIDLHVEGQGMTIQQQDNWVRYIEEYLTPRIDETVGKDINLRNIIGRRVNGEIVSGTLTDAAGDILKDANGNIVTAFKKTKNGAFIGFTDEYFDEIRRVVDTPNNGLKETFKARVHMKPGHLRGNAPDMTSEQRQIMNAKNQVVRRFFSELYPKREEWLNRSPAFRKFYYNSINNYLHLLAPGEAENIVRAVQKSAKDAKVVYDTKFLKKWVGSDELGQRILDMASGKIQSTGKRTHTEISALAKGYALDSTEELFYNAAAKSDFADVFRIITPFGSAWAEVMKSWTKILATNPENLAKVEKSVMALQEGDPDGDGKGFFWKDPQSGEYMFNYPFSKQLGPFIAGYGGAVVGGILGGAKGAAIGGLTGLGVGGVAQKIIGPDINPVFSAPAKSLNMGLQILPGFGPVVQLASSWIIPNIPKTDFIRHFVTPYGAPELTSLALPSWSSKLIDALSDPKQTRLLGDLQMDVMKTLAASRDSEGNLKYDLTDPRDRQRLENDAIPKARVLLVLRSLGQFVGPSRPDVDFSLETNSGDVFASEVSKAWNDMRAENYDTAVETFVNTFGEDFFLYMQGKTQTDLYGLEASKDFGRWERENSGFFGRHKQVAGFFADVGSDFDYQVYLRQLELGYRERIPADELVSMAQEVVGKALYRNAVRKVGPKSTPEQKAWLYEQKLAIQELYPGYATAEASFNDFERQLIYLKEASFDSAVDGNPVAEATRFYFEQRDAAIQLSIDRGSGTGRSLSGKNDGDLRDSLNTIGMALIEKYPEFARVWDQVFFNEVDPGKQG
jgi:hypothetical protein